MDLRCTDCHGIGLGSLAQYEEFLDHGELELALGELESLGEVNDMWGAYWRLLQEAATRLDLADRAAYYATKIG